MLISRKIGGLKKKKKSQKFHPSIFYAQVSGVSQLSLSQGTAAKNFMAN